MPEPTDSPLARAARALREAQQAPQSAREQREQAQRLRDMSQRLQERMSPEQRRELERLAAEYAQQARQQDQPRPPAPQFTGRTRPVDARATPQGPRQPTRDRVIAEWYSDRPIDPAQRGSTATVPAAPEQEFRRAAEAAERAIEQQTVPQRYTDLVRRVFRRYVDEPAQPPKP